MSVANFARDVNGPQKRKNFIGLKYEMLNLEEPWHNNMSESGENETVYCLCRRPYDPN